MVIDMKVYLVWMHVYFMESRLMGVYSDKQQAINMADAYKVPTDPDETWYSVTEHEVID